MDEVQRRKRKDKDARNSFGTYGRSIEATDAKPSREQTLACQSACQFFVAAGVSQPVGIRV
jgi:hypothetical protein